MKMFVLNPSRHQILFSPNPEILLNCTLMADNFSKLQIIPKIQYPILIELSSNYLSCRDEENTIICFRCDARIDRK